MFIELEGVINPRELGGVCTTNGKKVKKNMLFRCGELEKATDKDMELLASFGPKYIIDLRDPGEAAARPDREISGAEYVLLPALPPMPQPKERLDKPGPAEDLGEMFPRIYAQLAESSESIAAYKEFFRLMMAAEGRPVLWHCRQGKDRTGVAAILLLTALGVDLENCVREYLLTNEHMQPRFDRIMASDMEPWKKEVMKALLFVHRDWLQVYLDIVTKTYGGLSAYLEKVLEISQADMLQLRAWYLE